MKKAIVVSIMVTFVLLISNSGFAGTTPVAVDMVVLDNGNYFESVIEDEETAEKNFTQIIINHIISSKTTKTKSKTTYFKNSSGNVMWYVKVTDTFTYGKGSAKRTKSACTAKSKNKAWKVSNKSSSKSGNKASAAATGTHYLNGVSAESITKTVILKCSPFGNFS